MTLRRVKKALRTVPDGACAWITAAGIIAALAGPILIHAIVQSCEQPRFLSGYVEAPRQVRMPLDMHGTSVSYTAAIRVDERERFAWIIFFRSLRLDTTIRRPAVAAQIGDMPSWVGTCFGGSGQNLADMSTSFAFRMQLSARGGTSTYQPRYQLDVAAGPGPILIVELQLFPPKADLTQLPHFWQK